MSRKRQLLNYFLKITCPINKNTKLTGSDINDVSGLTTPINNKINTAASAVRKDSPTAFGFNSKKNDPIIAGAKHSRMQALMQLYCYKIKIQRPQEY